VRFNIEIFGEIKEILDAVYDELNNK